MPNHVHVIVIVDKIDDGRAGSDGRDAINRVSTETGMEMEPKPDPVPKPQTKKSGEITGNKKPMLHDNISRVFNWYTGRVIFESRKIDNNYGWQAGFHDHIIRNNAEYRRIKNYIINNLQNWNKDKFYS